MLHSIMVFLMRKEGVNLTFFTWMELQLLLLVGAKLEHIITRLAQDVDHQRKAEGQEAGRVKPSDEYFWFQRPAIVLNLIHFILFQNSFEIAFFIWIWVCERLYYPLHQWVFYVHLIRCTQVVQFTNCSARMDSDLASWKNLATSSQDLL